MPVAIEGKLRSEPQSQLDFCARCRKPDAKCRIGDREDLSNNQDLASEHARIGAPGCDYVTMQVFRGPGGYGRVVRFSIELMTHMPGHAILAVMGVGKAVAVVLLR